MTNRDRTRTTVDRITTDTAKLATHAVRAMDALTAAQPGPRSTPTDAGGRSTTQPDEATFNAAQAYSRDLAVHARRDFARALLRAERAIAHAANLAATWSKTATHAEAPDIWCQVCGPRGHRHPHEARRIGALVACRWAADWHRRKGTMPTKADVDRHAQGRRDIERAS
jgi:hypothetical protein